MAAIQREIRIMVEMFDEIGRNYELLWVPGHTDAKAWPLKRAAFLTIREHLERVFPGMIPQYMSPQYLYEGWQCEKIKYIELWRAQRANESIFAENLRFLNNYTTPEPAQHPFIEWMQRVGLEAELADQEQENRQLQQRLDFALRQNLNGQRLVNLLIDNNIQLHGEIQRGAIQRQTMVHQIMDGIAQDRRRAALIATTISLIQQILMSFVQNY